MTRYVSRWWPRCFRCPHLLPLPTGGWVVPTVRLRCARWRGHAGPHSCSTGRP